MDRRTLLALLPAVAGAQRGGRFSTETRMVLVPVGVHDKKGRLVEGLSRADFRLTDNGVAQEVLQCSLETGPREVAVVLDQSESMRPVLKDAYRAVRAFVTEAGPQDQVSVISVRDTAALDVAPTEDSDQALRGLGVVTAEGRTALFDGVYLALNRLLKSERKNRMLLIVSDGGDNASRYTARELADLALEAGTLIHAVVTASAFPISEEAVGQHTLRDLTRETGGWYIDAHRGIVIARVVEALRTATHYVLGYSPRAVSTSDGRVHRIGVKVPGRRGLRVTWRRTYRFD